MKLALYAMVAAMALVSAKELTAAQQGAVAEDGTSVVRHKLNPASPTNSSEVVRYNPDASWPSSPEKPSTKKGGSPAKAGDVKKSEEAAKGSAS